MKKPAVPRSPDGWCALGSRCDQRQLTSQDLRTDSGSRDQEVAQRAGHHQYPQAPPDKVRGGELRLTADAGRSGNSAAGKVRSADQTRVLAKLSQQDLRGHTVATAGEGALEGGPGRIEQQVPGL
jgi:hypothetical protein